MVFTINMGTGVNVITQTSNSSVTTGENTQFGWSSHQKRNYDSNNSGLFYATINNINWSIDTDCVDATFISPKALGGFTNQMT